MSDITPTLGTPYLGFVAVSLMIALSPGPSWAYTISTTHAFVAAIVHSHLILFSSGVAHQLKKAGKVQAVLRWATGTVSLGFGARLALTDR